MEKGPKKIQTGENVLIHMRADASFMVYGTKKKERISLLGPFDGQQRQLMTMLPKGCDGIEIKTALSTLWEVKATGIKSSGEKLDTSMKDLPISSRNQPNITDLMKMYVRSEFSRLQEKEGIETFEEADDFDVEEDEWQSPFELTEMQEEYHVRNEEETTSGESTTASETENATAQDGTRTGNNDNGNDAGSEQTVQSPSPGNQAAT